MSDAPRELPTFESLVATLKAARRRPVAFQALWEGDSEGWGLCLQAVVRARSRLVEWLTREVRFSAVHLAFLRFGGDLRLFAGRAWPESRVARDLGEQLAGLYGVPLWFPSPDEPDDDCPNWWERDRALGCQGCDKPILRREGGVVPPEYCYHCHLRREARERVRRDEPCAEGVTIVLGDGVADREILSTADAKHAALARFALAQPELAAEAGARGQLTLRGEVVRRWAEHLRGEIPQRLAGHVPRRLPPGPWQTRQQWRRVAFAGEELRLEVKFDRAAAEIHAAITALRTAEEALANGWRYWLIFHRGMTARTERVLCALREVGGEATAAELARACAGELEADEVAEVLARLVALGYVATDEVRVAVTAVGRHVR